LESGAGAGVRIGKFGTVVADVGVGNFVNVGVGVGNLTSDSANSFLNCCLNYYAPS